MACARTVAVVVPSPATSEVLEATSRTICAPMFSRPSGNSISFATVTPSLVMVGDPHFFSITPLRPLGPRVTFTASDNRLTPRRIACRDSSPCTICFAITCSPRILKSATPMFFLACYCNPRARLLAWTRTDRPTKDAENKLSLDSCGLFLRSTGDDSEDFLLFHDEEVFSINLDLGAGILGEQNAVAFFPGEREQFAFVIGLALSY